MAHEYFKVGTTQALIDAVKARTAEKPDSDALSPLLTAGAADGIKGGGPTVDAAFLHRVTGGGQASDGPATIEVVRGNTVRWNQLITSNNYWYVNPLFGEFSYNDGVASVEVASINSSAAITWTYYSRLIVPNHKYVVTFDTLVTSQASSTKMQSMYPGVATVQKVNVATNVWTHCSLMYTMKSDASPTTFCIYYDADQTLSVGDTVQFKNVNVFDLTAMFGSGNEPVTVAEFEALYPLPYYPYDAGSLLSVQMEGIATEDADGDPLQTRNIPAVTLRKAGTAYDELTATEHITRVGQTTIDGSGVGHWVYSVNVAGDVLQCRVFPAGLATISGSSANLVATGFTSKLNNSEPYDCYHSSDALWFILPTSAVSATTVAGANAWFAAHPTEVTFQLATPTVTTYDPPLNLSYRAAQGGTETVLVPTGEMSAPVPMVVVYGSTPDGILDRSASLLAAADGPTATANHGVGDYLTMGGTLYRVTTAIATGEAITIGTNVTATTVMAEILSLVQ